MEARGAQSPHRRGKEGLPTLGPGGRASVRLLLEARRVSEEAVAGMASVASHQQFGEPGTRFPQSVAATFRESSGHRISVYLPVPTCTQII